MKGQAIVYMMCKACSVHGNAVFGILDPIPFYFRFWNICLNIWWFEYDSPQCLLMYCDA